MEFTSSALKGGTVHFEKGLATKFIGIFTHTPLLYLVKYSVPLHAAKSLKRDLHLAQEIRCSSEA